MFTKMRVNRAVECIRGQVSSALEVELKQHAVEVPVSVNTKQLYILWSWS